MTKIHFPQFSREEYSPFEMRQLVQVLELRFQQLESNASTSLPTVEDDAGEFAPLVHTHREADIDDLSHVSSIFELTDVNAGFSEGQVLVWDQSAGAFVAGEAGSGGITTLSLDDLTDVSVQSFSSGDVLTYNGTTGLWEPAPVDVGGGVGVDTLLALTDTSVSTRVRGDFLFYDDPSWNPSGPNLRWNTDASRLELGNAAIISWKNSALVDVDFLTIDSITTTPAPAEAISAYLSFTQTEPGLMSTYAQVVDESGYSHAITYGTTAYVDDGTLGVPQRTGGGTFFDPQTLSDSWVELAPSSTFDLGTGDFCIEIWAYRSLGNPNINSGLIATGNLGWRVWWMSHSQGGDLRLQLNDVDVLSVEVATWTEDGAWNHIVFSRSETTITLYFNGFARGSTTSSADFTSAGGTLIVGEGTYNKGLVSYMPMDDFRLTKGYPVYTEDFTPPDPGYPDIVEERFVVGDPDYVTHIDGTRVELEHNVGIRWDDSFGTKIEKLIFGSYNDTGFATEPDSNLENVVFLATFENAGAIQAPTTPMNGAVDIGTTAGGSSLRWFEKLDRTEFPIVETTTTQAKFGGQSLQLNGGLQFSSGYFGTYIYSDHRTDPDLQFGTDDWTIECHFLVTSSTGFTQCPLLSMDSTDGVGNEPTLAWTLSSGGDIMNCVLGFNNGGVYTSQGFTSAACGFAAPDSVWHHMVVQKFGTQLQGFCDGVRIRDFTLSLAALPLWVPTASDPVQGLQIGGDSGSIGSQSNYYIDNFRITRGVARYQSSTYTPPAGPYEGTSFGKAFIVGSPSYPTVIDGTLVESTGAYFDSGGPLRIKEGAAAVTDRVGYSQIYVRNDTIPVPRFRDDDGNESTLNRIDVTSYTPTGTTQTLDFINGPSFEVDLDSATGDVEITLSGAPPVGFLGRYIIRVQQSSTTPRALSWAGGTFYWADKTEHLVTDKLTGTTIFVAETWDAGTSFFISGADYQEISKASGAISLTGPTASGSAAAGRIVNGSPTLEVLTASGVVDYFFGSIGSVTLETITASGEARLEPRASGAVTLEEITASGTATKI